MTEDLLERRLAESMTTRADQASPGAPRFAAVEGLAAAHRRRSARRRGGVAVGTVLVILGLVAVPALRDAGGDDVTVGPIADPATTAPVATAPAGVVGDRWAVLSNVEPTRSELATPTTVGMQPHVPGSLDVEVTPYLVVGESRVDREVIYALDGDAWTTTTSWMEPAPGAVASISLVTGSGFDPTRLHEVPNSTGSYATDAAEVPPPAVPLPYENARPEELLAAPSSRALGLPAEHLGLFDWVVVDRFCPSAAPTCRVSAIGGDAERVLLVDIDVPVGADADAYLASVELRAADELPLTPGAYPDPPPGAIVVPSGPASSAAPFLIVRAPLVRDDSAWPAEVPADYCTAYRQWKGIQMDHLGAFGTAGWIHWAEVIATMAPPEVGDSWTVLAAEQAAGHDTSASQPGVGALDTVVTDGDARCPL